MSQADIRTLYIVHENQQLSTVGMLYSLLMRDDFVESIISSNNSNSSGMLG